MQRYNDTVVRLSAGFTVAVSGASVAVTDNATGNMSTIYSDNGITTRTNPITTGSDGTFYFYAADGRYNITISGSDITTTTLTDIILEDPATYADEQLATDLASTSSAATGDALIGFKQSNSSGVLTGATARTVHQKLQEFVSVKDFGATGDGVTNDTAAFTAAGSVATKVHCIIPAGTYLLSTSPAPTGTVTWVLLSGATTSGAGSLPGRVISVNSATGSLSILNVNPSVNTAGECLGIKAGVCAGTEAGWTSNPGVGDYVAESLYISSSATRDRVWAINPIVDIVNGSPATAWCFEGNVNQANANAPDPRTTNHCLGIDMVSGSTYAPSAAYCTSGTTANNRWKHGIWFDYVGGQTGSTLIKANTNISVDYGLDLSSATVNYQGLRVGSTTSTMVAPIAARQFADGQSGVTIQRFTDTSPTGNLLQLVNTTNTQVLASFNASGDLSLATGGLTVSNGNVSVTAGNVSITAGTLTMTKSGANIELGSTSASNTPFIDFHSSGNAIDYDARVIASGGTANVGEATLIAEAGTYQFKTRTSATLGIGFQISPVASSVNYFTVYPSATGQAPTIRPEGTDTNITAIIQSKGTGNIRIDPLSGDIQWYKALVALGGGAAPTLGTIGGSGPAAAAQNSWLRILDSTGSACWVPVWK